MIDEERIDRDAMYLSNIKELEGIFDPDIFSMQLLEGSWFVNPHDRFNSKSDLRSFFFIDEDAKTPVARGSI